MQCFRKFPVAKTLMDKGKGEYQDFPSKKVSLTVPKISLGYPLVQCFRNLPVEKKFMDKRGEYQDFPSNSFSPTVPKNFVGPPC